MEIKGWSGDFGLPSIDCKCLQAMAYAKFCGAPVKIQPYNNPWFTPTGELPVFKHGPKVKLTKYGDIVDHLRKQNYSADFSLSTQQQADVTAYTALLRDKLYPALLYVLWQDIRNYTETTRPWYAKHLPFPLNYFVPGSLQKAAATTVGSVFDYENIDQDQLETLVYKQAQECLTLLSQRLGDQDFFFGKRPCSLDAVVFGYLGPLLKIPLPNATLQNYLKACSNLSQHVTRVLQRYFPLEDRIKNTGNPSQEFDDNDFPHKWLHITFASFIATVAMLGYAFASGLVQIEISDIDDVRIEEFDEEGKENRSREDEI